MTRRSFFNSLARTAAIIALAPQLAFRAKPIALAVENIDTTIDFEMTFKIEKTSPGGRIKPGFYKIVNWNNDTSITP